VCTSSFTSGVIQGCAVCTSGDIQGCSVCTSGDIQGCAHIGGTFRGVHTSGDIQGCAHIYFKYCPQRTCYSSFVHVVQAYMYILQRDHAIISLSFCPYLSFSLSLIPVVNLPPVSTTPAANNGNNIRLLIP
jgi:hypothetical protein